LTLTAKRPDRAERSKDPITAVPPLKNPQDITGDTGLVARRREICERVLREIPKGFRGHHLHVRSSKAELGLRSKKARSLEAPDDLKKKARGTLTSTLIF